MLLYLRSTSMAVLKESTPIISGSYLRRPGAKLSSLVVLMNMLVPGLSDHKSLHQYCSVLEREAN